MKNSLSVPILYRVVELCRGRHGRLEKLGSAWYADLNRVRAIGNWVARNTMAHKVWIATSTEPHFEEVPLPAPPYSTDLGALRADGLF